MTRAITDKDAEIESHAFDAGMLTGAPSTQESLDDVEDSIPGFEYLRCSLNQRAQGLQPSFETTISAQWRLLLCVLLTFPFFVQKLPGRLLLGLD